MKLGDHVEMVLGTCLSNDDPKKLGRIKVGAPGYFDRTVMAIEAIPWAYPLTMPHYQGYSTISEGGKVWLIDNKDNVDEFWYIPYHELNEDTKKAINDDIESDVCFSRNIAGELIQLYQNKTEGIVLRVGPTTVTLNHNGACIIESEGATVVVEGKTVYCGATGGEKEPMIRGNVLREMLKKLAGDMKELWTKAQQNPYTTALAPGFQKANDDIMSALPDLPSETCTLSK